jgi:bacillolysin
MPELSNTQKLALKKLRKLDPNVEVRWDKRVSTPVRLKGMLSSPKPGAAPTIAISFLTDQKSLFALRAPEKELQLTKIGVDAVGIRHVRFQQKYKDLPVFGRELVVHVDSENVVLGVNGKFEPDIDLPSRPKITAKMALKKVLADDVNNKQHQNSGAILVVFPHEGKAFLCWNVIVDGTDKALDGSSTEALWVYFVDALTGKVIWRYNNLQTHTATTGSGVGRYAGSQNINTVHNHSANNYQLEDRSASTGARIYTYDCNNGYPPCQLSTDSNNNWSAADQGPEVDCHFYMRIVSDYFLAEHGRNSYDDAGADTHIYAHVGANWNNAGWNPLAQIIKVGDGDGTTHNPYSTLDIIAHEWTHAVTEHTANLYYYGESGALNESISDVFAAIIDGNWLQAEDNWLGTTAPAERNLADPTNGGNYDPTNPITSVLAGHQPDHTNDQYTGTDDNGGVHINSGIMNKAAYLIAIGGTHRNIKICTGLGTTVLGRLYYQALTSHLTTYSDFEDMRDAVLDSLDDLYMGDSHHAIWRASVINAFAAVGVGTEVTCPVHCPIGPLVVVACPPSPTCIAGPIICKKGPYVLACPPSPKICAAGPIMKCPPSPIYVCPPAPDIQPHGCLPGPDPEPFRPKVKPRPERQSVG